MPNTHTPSVRIKLREPATANSVFANNIVSSVDVMRIVKQACHSSVVIWWAFHGVIAPSTMSVIGDRGPLVHGNQKAGPIVTGREIFTKAEFLVALTEIIFLC